ncbi:MAG: hypothetical protein AB1782_12965 [Cyanobacteriota bacterium]
MIKNKGSNIVEYVVPVALIGIVVGMGLFYMYEQGTLRDFVISSSNINFDSTTQKASLNNNSNPDEPLINQVVPATPDNPITSCENGICKIDFGPISLSGLPENFNDFVETSGASGSVDMMASLLDQIANQLLDDGLKNEYNDIKKLANIGHNLAAVENEIEKMIKNCNYNKACIDSFADKPFPMPENFDITVTGDLAYKTYAEAGSAGVIGGTRNLTGNNVSGILETGRLAPHFIETLDRVTKDSDISQDTRNLIKELSWDIGVIGEDFQNNLEYMSSWYDSHTLLTPSTFYDPITYSKISEPVPPDAISNYQTYNASKVTNFDSALICAAGQKSDSGSKCH